jgi:hypothetical protein
MNDAHPTLDNPRKYDIRVAIWIENGEWVEAESLPELVRKLGDLADERLSGKFLCPGCEIKMTPANRNGGKDKIGRNRTSCFRQLEEHRSCCSYQPKKKSGDSGGEESEWAEDQPPGRIVFREFPGDGSRARKPASPARAQAAASDILREDVKAPPTAIVIREACMFYATGLTRPRSAFGQRRGDPKSAPDRRVVKLELPGCVGADYGTVFRFFQDRCSADFESLYILYAEFCYRDPPRFEGDWLVVPLFLPDLTGGLPKGSPDWPAIRIDASEWPEDRREHFRKTVKRVVEDVSACSGRPLKPWFFFVGRLNRVPGCLPVADPGHPPSVFALACDMPRELRRWTQEYRPANDLSPWAEEPRSAQADTEDPLVDEDAGEARPGEVQDEEDLNREDEAMDGLWDDAVDAVLPERSEPSSPAKPEFDLGKWNRPDPIKLKVPIQSRRKRKPVSSVAHRVRKAAAYIGRLLKFW